MVLHMRSKIYLHGLLWEMRIPSESTSIFSLSVHVGYIQIMHQYVRKNFNWIHLNVYAWTQWLKCSTLAIEQGEVKAYFRSPTKVTPLHSDSIRKYLFCFCHGKCKYPCAKSSMAINISVASQNMFLLITHFSNKRLVYTGKDKLGVPASEPVRVVLECDGTQIEDGEYFRTLANNTVLLLLRQGERWYPTGVDVIKAGTYPSK